MIYFARGFSNTGGVGWREVTAKSLHEKVVGFCYSQHWSEKLIVRPLSLKDDDATGTTSKLLKVSPAEPLGFIRGHHRFLAVLAMLEFCACL